VTGTERIIVGGREGEHYSFREELGYLFDAQPDLGEEMVMDSVSRQSQLKEITDRLEDTVTGTERKEEQEKAIDELTPVKTAKKTIPQQGRSI